MPQKLLFDYNTEEKFSTETFEHPTHGFMKWLMVFNDYTESSDDITAIYFDIDHKHHEITSKKLTNCIHPQNFRTLLCAIETITDRRVYLEALLSLLEDDTKSISIGTQTLFSHVGRKVVLIKRQPSLSVTPVSESNGSIEVVENGDLENQVTQAKISKSNTESPIVIQVVKKEILDDQTSQLNDEPIETSENINKNVTNQENAENGEKTKDQEIKYEAALNDVINSKYRSSLVLYDGSILMLSVIPKDLFHMTAPNVMEYLTKEDRQRLIVHQAFIDWKYCLKPNSEGYTPIHLAVLHDDVSLLKRQIAVLKAKEVSIDVMALGMSPLHAAIKKNNLRCTQILLENGSNPLLYSRNHRNALHLAALATPEVFDAVLAAFLYLLVTNKAVGMKQAQINSTSRRDLLEIPDAFGYNAFMLACKHGNLSQMNALYKYCPKIMDKQMPSTGNTALLIVLTDFLGYAINNKLGPTQKAQLEVICRLLIFGANTTILNNYGLSFFDILRKCRTHKLYILNHVLDSGKLGSVMFETFWAAFVQNCDENKRNPDPWLELYHKALLEEAGSIPKVVPWDQYRKSLEENKLNEPLEQQTSRKEHRNKRNNNVEVVQKIVPNKVKRIDVPKNYSRYCGYFKTLTKKRDKTPKTNMSRRFDVEYSKSLSIVDFEDLVFKENSTTVPFYKNNSLHQKDIATNNFFPNVTDESFELKATTKKRKHPNCDTTSVDEKRTHIFNNTKHFVKINSVLDKVNDIIPTDTSVNVEGGSVSQNDTTSVDEKRTHIFNNTKHFVKINSVLDKVNDIILTDTSVNVEGGSASQNDILNDNPVNIDNDINNKLERNADFGNISKVSVRGTPIQMRKVFAVRKVE